MDATSNIVVTGAAGFIGSCLVRFLNEAGFKKLILVDEFLNKEKNRNLKGKDFVTKIDREEFFDFLD